jgi:hypothetical protein
MNTLSLLILAIGFLENVGAFLTGGLILTGLGAFVFIFACGVIYADFSYCNAEERKRNQETRKSLKSYTKWCVAGFVVCAMLNVFVIDKNYIVMIAASEIGELAIKSDGGKQLTGLSSDAIDLLKVYVDSEKENLIKTMKDKAETAISK